LKAQPLTIAVEGGSVSALYLAPSEPRACYVLAHGAGAGMAHPFMAAVADGLAERGIATLRYQFPYMEKGSKRPDAPKVAQAAVRAAVAGAARLAPGLRLIAGGKSFGGRMTSQAQAVSPLPGVRGLAFLGFPLHAAGQPSDERAKHLFDVKVPMLFLQGAADKLADPKLLQALVEQLQERRTGNGERSAETNVALKLFPDADHSFHVRARTGRKDAELMKDVLDAFASWITY
jgi:predicted alpha/beta-hydrolase family hydrolase